jgi:2-polyprenyl-6-hydroxyphenyl methylase/3-demethylubiquinone-9 3-methyltransferase
VSWFTRFVHANRHASASIGRHLPQNKVDLQREYANIVTGHLHGVVIDVGAGKKTHFTSPDATIVGVDIAFDEIAYNRDVDHRIVASADALAFAGGTADLVVTRSTIEHLRDTNAFLRDVHRVLKPGGELIGVLPSKYAPFSLLNRLLPDRVAQMLLRILIPGSHGRLGFPAFYDQTYPSGMRTALDRAGFDVRELRVSYAQAHYFGSLVPVFVLNAIYELIVRALKLEDLAATLLFVAVKRS